MRHGVAGRKLHRATDHRLALYRNLVTDLLRYEKVVTTQAKASEAKALAERMITLGKEGGLSARRQALAFIYDEEVVKKLFSELARRYQERQGGYTRLVKLGRRQGDSAQMAKVELVP